MILIMIYSILKQFALYVTIPLRMNGTRYLGRGLGVLSMLPHSYAEPNIYKREALQILCQVFEDTVVQTSVVKPVFIERININFVDKLKVKADLDC